MRKHLPPKDYFLNKKIPGYGDYVIKEYINSGMNAHMFRAYNETLSQSLACKIIPVANLQKGSIDNENWKIEAQRPNILQSDAVVKCRLQTIWKDPINNIDCLVLCFDYIDGVSLSSYIDDNKDNISINFIENILKIIFPVLYELKERGMEHGDLHEGNILVESPSRYSLGAEYRFRITDFSTRNIISLSMTSDDYFQIAHILRKLLSLIDYGSLSPRDKYKYNIFNYDFLARHLQETDPTIDPYVKNPKMLYEKLNSLDQEFIKKESTVEVSRLTTPFDYLSCEQIGDAHGVLQSLYSDKFLALADVQDKNNLILTGPRGCGKSTVFRSLSLFHRYLVANDGQEFVSFIGIYYRCDDLYFSFPRYKAPDNPLSIDIPLHFIITSLLFEALESLEFWGKKHYPEQFANNEKTISSALWELFEFAKPTEPGSDSFKRIQIKLKKERKRAADKQRFINDPKQTYSNFFGVEILTKACDIIQKGFPFLANRPFYFFIDDYSFPKITFDLQRNLNRLFMQRSHCCFFKLSTESPVSYSSEDVDGKAYVEGREFRLINLGILYLHEDPATKLMFIEDVFQRRLNAVPNYPCSTLDELIGDESASSFNEIARDLRDSKHQTVYGKTSLSNLCSGDIHYIINLVGKMVSTFGGPEKLRDKKINPRVNNEIQNKVIREEAGRFLNDLRSLSKHGEQLVNIVTTFGIVAHSYLMYKSSGNEGASPPHQCSRIEPLEELNLNSYESEVYTELLRYSVFIEDRRGKSLRGKVVPRLYLRRFLIPHFNLTFSKRDSMTLEPQEFSLLLKDPKKFEELKRLRKKTIDKPRLL